MQKQLKTARQGAAAAKEYAERSLDGRLLEHTRGSVETARKLAHRFGLDEGKAVIASYLHDIAKQFPRERQIALAGEMGMAQAEIDSYPLAVLHGPLAALIAQKELGIEDAEVLQAILAHSTGCAGMCDIAKIVFIADYIEETRSFPGAGELRSRGNITLDELTTAILRRKLNHLIGEDRDIDPRAIDLWNDLMKGTE